MAKAPRPVQAVTALKRLGYLDRPSIGDHVSLFKSVPEHPDGRVTIQTGIDMGQKQCSKKDIARVQRQTKLKGELWDRAIAHKITLQEYNAHLRTIPKADLVIPFFRNKVIDESS